jgi:hypothetical protein
VPGRDRSHPAWQTLAVSEAAVYMSSSVAPVRALWDRSGLFAGPVIGAQLSQFAEALVAAYAADARSAAVLVATGRTSRTTTCSRLGGSYSIRPA